MRWHNEAKDMYEKGVSLQRIGSVFGKSAATVKSLVTKRRWKRHPERFHEGVSLLADCGEEFRQVGDAAWVSNFGRVVSRRKPGFLVKPYIDKDGYLRVGKNQKSWDGSRHIHRLVLEAFIGPCPEGMTAAHLDGSRNNNSLENLAWKSHADNCAQKKDHGTWQAGERHPNSALTNAQARKIKDALRFAPRGPQGRLRRGTPVLLAQKIGVEVKHIYALSRARGGYACA